MSRARLAAGKAASDSDEISQGPAGLVGRDERFHSAFGSNDAAQIVLRKTEPASNK